MFDMQTNINNLTAELKKLKLTSDTKLLFKQADPIAKQHGWQSLSKEPMTFPDSLIKAYYRTSQDQDIFYFIGVHFKKNVVKQTIYYVLDNSMSKTCPQSFTKVAKNMLFIKRAHNKNPS